MFRKIRFSHFVLCFSCLLPAAVPTRAQGTAAPQSPSVTAAATTERVRFTAPSTVQQIRLEVYNAAGVKLFDNEVRGGNVLDWRLQDGQAEPLADGAYLCLVTVKYVSGRISQKLGALRIEQRLATVQPAEAGQMSAQQAQAIGPVEAQASLIVLGEEERQTATVIAHTGSEGQLIRGSGALSFRLGDFYGGQDREQMRLTAEGKLGLGVSDPQAKLDVAGPIRTSEGVIFPDGTVQTTAYLASGRSLGERSRMQQRDAQGRAIAGQEDKSETSLRFAPSISGTGTTNRLTKWIDGPGGVVGDTSSLTEIGGSFGLGKTPDSFRLDLLSIGRYASRFVSQTGTGDLFNIYNNNGGNLIFGLESSTGNSIFSGTSAYSAVIGHDNARSLHLATNNIVRQTIDSSGNVGIGTTSPQSKLTVQASGYGITQTDGTVTVGSFINPTAGWFGTKSNHPLNFFTNDSLPQMTLATSGNVGIGISPTNKLHVLSSTPGLSAIYGESATGRGVWGKSTSSRGVYGESTSLEGVYGISSSGTGVTGASTSGSGVYGQTAVSSPTAGGVYGKGIGNDSLGVIGESNTGDNAVGVYGVTSSLNGFGMFARNNTAGGRAFYADGNVAQSLASYGVVKAMLEVDRSGVILRCYNGISNTSSGNCGITITNPLVGVYRINFGFLISSRFVSITPEYCTGCFGGNSRHSGANYRGFDSTSIEVFTFGTNSVDDTSSRGFTLILY